MVKWKREEIPDDIAKKIGVDNRSKQIRFIERCLEGIKYSFRCEYRFHNKRRFRIDYYVPELDLGVEYEGIISKKSRHTTIKGYSQDCVKYNLAQLEGITVLRYTALNYERLENDLQTVLNKKDE